jgi:translation initiation factor IF-3
LAFRGRGPRFIPQPPPDTHRINRNIRAPQVRLIGPDGSQIGIVPIEDALRRAQEAELDLVEIAPTAQPPVCRILNYGKFKYQQHKKETEARRKQTITTVKELRLGYRTSVGDVDRQIERAREFLSEGDRVKFTLRFRGREMAYQDLGRKKLMGVCEALQDIASVEGNPKMEGRMMGVILTPSVKKKPAVKAAAKQVPKEDGEEPQATPSQPTS